MGLSVWRGKFDKTSGTVTMDRAKTGALDVEIDAASIDFGLEKMNKHAKTSRHVQRRDSRPSPTPASRSSLKATAGGVDGELTMLGVTKPVALKVNKFKCIMHPRYKREVCGADAMPNSSAATSA
jgi:polyisoprenoid-binding protein YceI